MGFSRKITGAIIGSIIIIAIIVGIGSNTEFSELKIAAQKVNFEFIDILEECMSTTSITSMKACETELKEMQDQCLSNELLSSMSFCNDSRILEFYETVEDRVEHAKTKIVDIVEDGDTANLRMIELCYSKETSEEMTFCKEILMEIKDSCKLSENSQMVSCSDPRVDEILSKSMSP